MKSPTFAPLDPPPPLRPGEPYFLLRAQDQCSLHAINAYAHGLLVTADSLAAGPPEDQAHAHRLRVLADDVNAMADYFLAWQLHHADLVKLPD